MNPGPLDRQETDRTTGSWLPGTHSIEIRIRNRDWIDSALSLFSLVSCE